MKCPHCNQDHPDNFQFCPIEGLPISLKKACKNKTCCIYGQHILPSHALFCPECGHSLEGENNYNPNNLEFMVDGISFTMILVEHGEFMMGATEEQDASDENENPVHRVRLTRDYYIGETPVTQALWRVVMNENPSWFGQSGHGSSEYDWEELPVEQVSWDDCQKFIRKLNKLTGSKFRLPTEAEWEFAARGGKESCGYQYSGGDEINNVAWYDEIETYTVKEQEPNELGIYDMSGNVWEWCSDWFGDYSSNAQSNPIGPSDGSYRVIRGGSWHDGAASCRVASRDRFTPTDKIIYLGLRLALCP